MFGFEGDEPVVAEDRSDDPRVRGDPAIACLRHPAAATDLVDDSVDARSLGGVDSQLCDGFTAAGKHFEVRTGHSVRHRPMGALFDPVVHPSDPRVGSLDAERTSRSFEINCWLAPGHGRGSLAGFRSHAD